LQPEAGNVDAVEEAVYPEADLLVVISQKRNNDVRELVRAAFEHAGQRTLTKVLLGKLVQEAKALAEGAPKTIKEGVTKPEAEEIKKKIEAAGAKVEIK